jgi:UDP-3-O-[3-hydroxymyristoyl] N-acetylglucosamine deacetylase
VGQQTVAEKVSCTGIGLHTGKPVQLTLLPARVGTGVVFVRTDRPDPIEIPARAEHVRSTRLATTLGRGGATIGTVEHLLAALYGLGIDNVRIEVDGPELPVMDGSAAPFVYLIGSAGIYAQSAPRSVLRVREPIELSQGDQYARVEPARVFGIDYVVDFAHPSIGRQQLSIDEADRARFERELSAARTFGFLQEVRQLWSAGLARGGSLCNTVVLDRGGVVNREGLRWPDEFVRHKVLDLFGDLALLGLPLRARVRIERGGHSLHQALVRAILSRPDAWRIEHRGVLDLIRSSVV